MSRLGLTWDDAGLVVVTAVVIYAVMIFFSRLFGPRQFASSSSYDLAFTFALGTLIGRVILVRTTLAAAVLGLTTMFVLHTVTGWLHHRYQTVHNLLENRPVLLAVRGRVLDENLKLAHTSRAEFHQHLRLHGIGCLEDVGAAIMERNGDVSILPADERLEPEVFADVIGREYLESSGAP